MKTGTRLFTALVATAAVLLPAAAGCGRAKALKKAESEKKKFTATVEKIHEDLLTIMKRNAVDLVPVTEMEALAGGGGSIQELHERSEIFMDDMERTIRTLEEEISFLETRIKELRSAPPPHRTPAEAEIRKQALEWELMRVQALLWRKK